MGDPPLGCDHDRVTANGSGEATSPAGGTRLGDGAAVAEGAARGVLPKEPLSARTMATVAPTSTASTARTIAIPRRRWGVGGGGGGIASGGAVAPNQPPAGPPAGGGSTPASPAVSSSAGSSRVSS